MKFKEAVTYDDMLMVPQYSDIVSRNEVDIKSYLGDREFSIPIIASPMDTISETEMAKAMGNMGGLAVLHRYNSITEQQRMAQHLIGYQPRTYLKNIINDDVAQYKFYQGYMRNKFTTTINKIFFFIL